MDRGVKWVLGVLLAALAVMSVQLLMSYRAMSVPVDSRKPDAHIQIISAESDTFFYAQFTAGAQEAAAQNGVYAEMVVIDKWDPDTLGQTLLQGIYAGVDALAFQSGDLSLPGELFPVAQLHGVELLMYESENLQPLPVLTAGSNSYGIGMAAGKMALDAMDKNCRAILILDKPEAEAPSAYQNMKVQGILEQFTPWPLAEIVEIYSLDDSMLAGERVTSAILNADASFNTIICLHEKTTPLLAQRLLDAGLVGGIQLIGYGALPETLDYIRRNIIYGTVCPDAFDVGFNTVKLLAAKLKQQQVNDYTTTKLFSITNQNVDDFMTLRQSGGLSE